MLPVQGTKLAKSQAPAILPVPTQTTSRRTLLSLLSAATLALSPLLPLSSYAADATLPAPGSSRYIRKKALDPLETYVPALLAARDQLLTIHEVAAQDTAFARSLLRSGPFGGIRDNVRSVGEYAIEGGRQRDEVEGVVKGFFRAVEKYDNDLFRASRDENKLPPTTQADFDAALKAFDAAIALVPEEAVAVGRKVLEQATRGMPQMEGGGGEATEEMKLLEKLL